MIGHNREMEEFSEPLIESDLAPDPFTQFATWYERARRTARLPEAAALATVGSDGCPSLRMVLVHGVDERGFRFFTNYESRKAVELDAHSDAAIAFYWDGLGRQVRVEGSVARVGTEESDEYFASRPRRSQLGAHASRQSHPIDSREVLDRQVAEVASRFDGRPIPRPLNWGGYRLEPRSVEFWQNRDDRLHDRFCYQRSGDGWEIVRLKP